MPDPDNPQGSNHPTTIYAYDVAGNLLSVTDARANADEYTVDTMPTDGLVAYWKLDEAGGTQAVDSSGHGRTGTLYDMTSPDCWVSGHDGGALEFDGTNDYVNATGVGTNVSYGGFNTFSLWMKWDGPPGNGPCVMRSACYYVWLSYSDATVSLYVFGRGYLIAHVSDVDQLVGKWVHIAAVCYNASSNESLTDKCAIYLNGKKLELAYSITDNSAAVAVSDVVTLNLWKNFNGILDDARVYNRKLTDAEVAALADQRGVTRYEYDALGRKVKEIGSPTAAVPGGPWTMPVTSYAYDAAGNVVAVTDALDHATEYEYDALGRKTKETLPDPDGQTGSLVSPVTTYTYDVAGNLSSMTDARANAGEYTVDTLPTDGLVAYWKMDETSNIYAADSSGNGCTGTLSGLAFAPGTEGRFAGALAFDGTNDFVTATVPGVNINTGYFNTVSFWVKWDGVNNDAPFGWGNYNLVFYNGGFGFSTWNNDVLGVPNGGLAHRWVHVVAVFCNGTIDNNKLYIDGEEMTLSEWYGPTHIPRSADNTVQLSGVGSTSWMYKGLLDDVRIYNRALTEPEVAALADQRGVTRYEYDALGRLTEEIGSVTLTADGTWIWPTTTQSYDVAGNLIAATDALDRVTRYEYDALGRVTKEILPDPNNPQDVNCPTTSYAYDAAGNVASVTDALGHVTDYEYDLLGRLTKEILPDPDGASGRPTTYYSYDILGNLICVTDALGTDGGSVEHVAPLEGVVVHWKLNDAEGAEMADASGNGRDGQLAAPEATPTWVSGHDGGALHFNTDDYAQIASGLAVDTITADAKTTVAFWMKWDNEGGGWQMPFSWKKGNPNWDGYDLVIYSGRLGFNTSGGTHLSCPISSYTGTWVHVTAVFNNGVVSSETCRIYLNGVEQTLTQRIDYATTAPAYVDDGARLSGWDNTIPSAYGFNGSLDDVLIFDHELTETEICIVAGVETNHTTWYAYDALGRQTHVTDALGRYAGDPDHTVETAYDAVGNVVATTDQLGRTTQYEYDPLGRLTKEIQPDPDNPQGTNRPTTTYAYDATGNLISSTDPVAHTTRYRYDALGRQTHEMSPLCTDPEDTDPDHATVTAYNSLGQVVAITDAEGNETTFDFDPFGRLTSQIDPNGHETTHAYDVVGNLARSVDRNGRITTYAYDRLNQVRFERWYDSSDVPGVDPPVETITTTYNALGQVATIYNSAMGYAYDYDALGRVVESTYVIEPGAAYPVEIDFAFTYDALGNLVCLADSLGGQTDYLYDALGQMSRIEQSGTDVDRRRVDFTYTDNGFWDTIARYFFTTAYQLVGTSQYEYDRLDRLVGLLHENAALTTMADYAWSYDLAGRMTSMDALEPWHAGVPFHDVTFEYDDEDQLLEADYATNWLDDESYLYDDNGNRLSVGSETYDTATGNRLTYDGMYTYLYDAEGNRTVRFVDHPTLGTQGEVDANDFHVTRYQWDHRNRLVAVSKFDDGAPTTPASMIVEYTYDAFDQRIARLEQWTGFGNPTYSYQIHHADQVYLELADADGLDDPTEDTELAVRYLYGPAVDQILAVENEAVDVVLWGLANHEGTIINIINNEGSCEHLDFDAFGQLESIAGGTFPIIFAGRPLDRATGLYDYCYRWYDPAVGRFLTEDPSGLASDANLYRYCGNNPLVNVDPSGLCYTGVFNAVTSAVSDYASARYNTASSLWNTASSLGSLGSYNSAPSLSATDQAFQQSWATNAPWWNSRSESSASYGSTLSQADLNAVAEWREQQDQAMFAKTLYDPLWRQRETDAQWAEFDSDVDWWLDPKNPGPDNWALAGANEAARGAARFTRSVLGGAVDVYLGAAVDVPMIALDTWELQSGGPVMPWQGVSSFGRDEGGSFGSKVWNRGTDYALGVTGITHGVNQYDYFQDPTPQNAARVQDSSPALLNLVALAKTLPSRGALGKPVVVGEVPSEPAFTEVPNAGASGRFSTLRPGPFARESVSLEGVGRRPTAAQQRAINELGSKHGCHTCGSRSPGTQSGNWILDHQPPTAMTLPGEPQMGYPHCVDCYKIQGGQVRAWQQ